MRIINNKKYYLVLGIIILSSIFLLGCQAEEADDPPPVDDGEIEQLNLEQPDVELLAYQLEAQIRYSFQTAYQSWLNLERISEQSEDEVEQIFTVLNFNLASFVRKDLIEEELAKLRNINEGGEGEMTFPTHEVVHEAEIITERPDQGDDQIQVEINATRYFPATEWAGEAYNEDFNYIVTLSNQADNWIVEAVDYQE